MFSVRRRAAAAVFGRSSAASKAHGSMEKREVVGCCSFAFSLPLSSFSNADLSICSRRCRPPLVLRGAPCDPLAASSCGAIASWIARCYKFFYTCFTPAESSGSEFNDLCRRAIRTWLLATARGLFLIRSCQLSLHLLLASCPLIWPVPISCRRLKSLMLARLLHPCHLHLDVMPERDCSNDLGSTWSMGVRECLRHHGFRQAKSVKLGGS